jgi:polyhydroxyalkanoate synthase
VREKLRRLTQRLGPAPNPDFDRALAAESIRRARAFLGGIRAYRDHPAQRRTEAAPVIWRRGTTLLRDYKPGAPDAPAALIVPSLINRFDILDLDRDHSFLGALAAAGIRPLVVDWDAPGAAEQEFTLAHYITERLVPMLDVLEAERRPVHLVGYCMGGNLALALAMVRPASVRTLGLLATPWDFHAPDAHIGAQFLALAAQLEPSLQALGHLPVEVVQSLFANLQPAYVTAKFTDFAGLDPASLEARHFVLCEDWLNDGVPLTAPVARECLRGWWGENVTGETRWRIGGTLIDPRRVKTPAYVVVPGRDRIVPPESALPLARQIPGATLHEPMMGHIGIIASEKAPSQVWAPFFAWLAQHG